MNKNIPEKQYTEEELTNMKNEIKEQICELELTQKPLL